MTDTDPTDTPIQDPPADDPVSGGAAAPEPAEPEFQPVTSQEDFDKRIQERLRRQRSQFPSNEELAALREKAKKADEIEQAQMSELERANTRLAELEAQNAAAAVQRQEALLKAAVMGEATRRQLHDPDAALRLLDHAKVEYDDLGNPTNVADAMDELLKAKPYLAGGGGTRASADLGARGADPATSQLGPDALKTMTPEQIVKARREGRFDALSRGEA